MADPISAAIGAGGSLIGGAISSGAAGDAADAQTAAANRATDVQRKMFEETQKNLKPFIQGGTTGFNALLKAAGLSLDEDGNVVGDPLTSPLLKPVTMDQATLEATPGYKFNLDQGLRAVNNSAAARGLGDSGAALKGAAEYATGLADSTYQNQFSNAVTNQTNQFNRLMSISNLGQSSAANQGTIGTQTAANIGNNLIGAGNAQGAAAIAGGNAWNNAFGNIGSMAMLAAMQNRGGINNISGTSRGIF